MISLHPEVVAASEAAFRAKAMRLGREAAEVAAACLEGLEGPRRAAFLDDFAEKWAANYIAGARGERARIRNILQSPAAAERPEQALRIALDSKLEPAEAALLLEAGDGAELQVFNSSHDRVTLIERMRASTSLAGRA